LDLNERKREEDGENYIIRSFKICTLHHIQLSHKSGAIGELGYLAKYGGKKEGKVVENHVFPNSSVRILYLGRAVTVLHS
jgi:hypothetical protein